MTKHFEPVLLCGCSGKRLWPLCWQSFPKQFVPLLGRSSLRHLTVRLTAALAPKLGSVQCVAAAESNLRTGHMPLSFRLGNAP